MWGVHHINPMTLTDVWSVVGADLELVLSELVEPFLLFSFFKLVIRFFFILCTAGKSRLHADSCCF